MRGAARFPKLAKIAKVTTLIALAIISTACAGTVQTRRASSVVSYLYPERADVVERPGIPVLELPLRVGIAFVPEDQDPKTARYGGGNWNAGALDETDRLMLMNEVAKHFRERPFVKSIELIPSAYLSPRGSFTNLEQIRTMFDVDVVALLSYDQVQFSGDTKKSFVYWTILGAYVIEGQQNDTRTMLDAAVYDIKSRKLLFRAPGMSVVKGSSAPIDRARELAADRKKGFDDASKDLAVNLDRQMKYFEQRVKERPDDIKVVASQEYKDRARASGAGSLSFASALAVVLLGVAGIVRRSALGSRHSA